MVYGRKRLVARAVKNLTAVSAAHLPKFPPPQARVTGFDVEVWGAVQPPPPSALSAFAHRIGLGAVLTDTDLILQACTHPSAQYLAKQQDPDAPPLPTNAHLGTLGNALMGLFATEYVHASYPYLPTRVLKAAVTAHVGPLTCSNVAQEMGAVPLLRWHRTPPNLTTTYQPPLQRSDALAREVDIRAMIKFMVAKFDREPPKSRLLKETGRFSNSPVFVLGEGFGASLKMAEYRAAEDALLSVYLTRTPPELLQLPTSTFPLGIGDVFREAPEGAYVAPELEHAEVMYASGGRSGVTPQPQRSIA
ncbi:hypothetical protein B0H13DRAFT_2110188 [Mycena leptocephala]|nr:hypothetical protein B0H13DRAFT_2110188 [Mycena leptocephala]